MVILRQAQDPHFQSPASRPGNYLQQVILLLLFILPGYLVQAQVTVVQQPVVPMQFVPQDLWKMTVTNLSGSAQTVYLKARISGSLVKEPLATLTSSELELGIGTTRLDASSVPTAQVVYGKYPGLDKIQQFKVLPYGEYTMCVEIYQSGTGDQLAESCQEVEFNPVAPPVLVLPARCEDPMTKLPVFTWFPPAPILKGYTVVYDFKLTELYQGQSFEDAIQRNIALQEVKGLRDTRWVYPASALALDTAKTYVWQVAARLLLNTPGLDGSNTGEYQYPIGLSEVWCIQFDKKPKEPDPKLYSYAIPKPASDAAYTEALNVLRFAWNEPYVPGTLQYTITDDKGKTIDIKKELTVNKGDNRYELDLKNTGLFRHKRTYTLTVKDARGTKSYLRFLYKEE